MSTGGEPPPARHRWLTLVVLCVSLLMVSLDNTILNVALPAMVRSMHATAGQLQWIVDSFAVVFAGLLLVAGNLGDRVGRKWVFLAGLALFAAGSAAAAFSATPDHLIAARAFMGIGAAAIMPSTLSILTNVFTGADDRSRAIGIWSGTTGLGVALGPVVGGWLLAHFWWGSVFLVNVPIAVVGVVAALWLVPNSKNPSSPRPDPVGGALSILGMSVLLWGIIEAPSRSWSSPLVIGSICLGVLVLAGFVLWERACTHPLLDLTFFRSRRFSVAIGAMTLVIFGLMGGMFLLTQYLQFSLGFSALQAGLRIAPIAALLLVVAPLSAYLDRVIGTRPVVCTGMVMLAVAFVLLSRTTTHSTYADALPAFLLMGVGTGLCFAPCTEAVMGSVPPAQAGVGSATNSTALQIGGALGVGVLGSLLYTRYQNRMAPVLVHFPVPKPVSELITGSLGGALGVAQSVGGKLGAGLAAVARAAFVSGMDLAVTVAAVVLGAAAVIVLVALPDRGDRGRGGRREDAGRTGSAATSPAAEEV